MIIAMAMGIALVVINILCLVFFFIVLVKMFKNEGALKGILGFFCSIYTFIWGWMKHKQLGMTKTMAAWSILTVAGMVMVPIMGAGSALMIPQYLQEMTGGGKLNASNLKSTPKTPSAKLTKKNKLKKTAARPAANKSTRAPQNKGVDWNQKALALWQGSRYKDPQKAINYWNHSIKSEQNQAAAYSNRGIAYHDLKAYRQAVNDFSQAIKLDPKYATAYMNRGNSYYELNEYQLALNDYNQSLKLKPQYAKAHLNRGLVFYQLDKKDQACQDFQKSCDHGDCDGLKWAMKNGLCK